MGYRKLTTASLTQDPTGAQSATVTGIAQPAQPQAAVTAVPPPTSPITVPAINYTPTPTGIGPVTGPTVPAAANPADVGGISPITIPTAPTLPDQRDDSVEAAIARITSEDSALMKQARAAGLMQANRRGVMNSSIGIGAAEGEALRTALPIAQQEAAQAAAQNQQRYDLAAQFERLIAQAGFEQMARKEGYAYTAALNTQSYAFQAEQQKNQQQFTQDMAKIQQGYAVDMAGLQYTLQSKLQTQANQEQLQRMAVDFSNQMKLQADAAKNALAQIKAQGDVQLTLQANQFEQSLKELTLTLDAQNSIAMANASVNLFQAEAGLRAALLGNETMPAAERAAYEQQISGLMGPVQNYVSGVLGYTPSGGAALGTGTPAPSTGTPGTGTTYPPPASGTGTAPYVRGTIPAGGYGGIAPVGSGSVDGVDGGFAGGGAWSYGGGIAPAAGSTPSGGTTGIATGPGTSFPGWGTGLGYGGLVGSAAPVPSDPATSGIALPWGRMKPVYTDKYAPYGYTVY